MFAMGRVAALVLSLGPTILGFFRRRRVEQLNVRIAAGTGSLLGEHRVRITNSLGNHEDIEAEYIDSERRHDQRTRASVSGAPECLSGALSLFGAKALGLGKPLMALITLVSVSCGYWCHSRLFARGGACIDNCRSPADDLEVRNNLGRSKAETTTPRK
jgi:hypothetical protein